MEKRMPNIKYDLLPKKATKKGPTNPPMPKRVWRTCSHRSCLSPAKVLSVATLQEMLMTDRLHEPKHKNTAKLANVIDSDDITNAIPPRNIADDKITWMLNLFMRYFTSAPPHKYPKVRQNKINEKYVDGLPVSAAK